MKFSVLLALLVLLMLPPVADGAEKVLGPNDSLRIELNRRRKVTDVDNGSIGEKLAEFEPTMKITNGSFNDFPGNRVCVLLLGEDTTRKNSWKVIYRREFDASFLGGKIFEWTGDSFEQGFDRTMAKSGYDYAGYIVIIKNSEGNPVISGQTKAYWGKDRAKAWDLADGAIVDKRFFE